MGACVESTPQTDITNYVFFVLETCIDFKDIQDVIILWYLGREIAKKLQLSKLVIALRCS